MKNECEIVQDLLFGYNDGVISKYSKELVEEHLKSCKKCSRTLEEIREDINNNNEKKEIDYLKKVNKKMNKKTITITIISSILLLILVLNVIILVEYYNDVGNVEIYLDSNISQEQEEIVKDELEKMYKENKIRNLEYFSKEKELEKMKEKFKNKSYLLDNYEEENNIFLSRYNVNVKVEYIKEFADFMANIEGVKKVITNLDENPYVYFLGQCIMKVNN